ncbi:MAG: capsular polysaccharide synthesis protein [Alphaproteobacteria bacterium]|nr:capsular polysaccharide synthesis protein [Alphaproteobacteria bacterium]
MNIARMFATLKIIIVGHILNPFWLPRVQRRKIRTNYTAHVITKYFKRYLPAVSSVSETKVIHADNTEKIWTIWLQGEEKAPALVRACYRSVRRHCSQELVVLDEKSIFDYISLPDVIVKKYRDGKIGHAHFADICRVELLYKYGGYWLDSTGFVTAPIPQWITDSDFFVFLTGDNYDIGGSPYSFMQNCFIRARRGAYLLAAWRAMILEYWLHENHTFDYFMHQLLFKTLVTNDERAKKHFAKMPHVAQDPTHALWWKYSDKPYNKKQFDEITSGAFFQKTTYRGSDNPIPNSFADEMINKM